MLVAYDYLCCPEKRTREENVSLLKANWELTREQNVVWIANCSSSWSHGEIIVNIGNWIAFIFNLLLSNCNDYQECIYVIDHQRILLYLEFK